MSCDVNVKFKEINSISEDLLLNMLEINFKTFLDWSFLNIGAWFDAKIEDNNNFYSSSNVNYKLLLVDDPSYESGCVWQGIRKDWVWESDVAFGENTPIVIDGVYINDNFLNYTSGDFIIDYPLGRIIFNSPISTTSTVTINYSYRHVQVYRASDSPWFSIMQYSSLRNNDESISQNDSGDWSIGGQHRIQLPAIVIESLARSRSKPYELGSTALILEQDIAFHILAENKNDRNKLLDILRLQQDLVIGIYNTNTLSQADKYPLDHNGDLKVDPLMYPDMIEQYGWRKCWIKNVNLFEIDSPNPSFHQGMARVTLEVVSH